MAFSFSCTKCGECCKAGGPALSIDEALKYQDVFITGLSWTARSVSEGHVSLAPGKAYVPSQELRTHFSSLCASFTRPRGGDTYYPLIYPSVTGYDLAPGTSCTALNDDGTCRLQADKPDMCKSVPFDPMLPESLQEHVLRKFRYDCMVETGDGGENLIFSDGRIVSAQYRHDYDQRLSAMKRDMPQLIGLASLLGDGIKPGRLGLPSLTAFFETTDRGGWIETS